MKIISQIILAGSLFLGLYSCQTKENQNTVESKKVTKTNLFNNTKNTDISLFDYSGKFSFGGSNEEDAKGSILIYPQSKNSALFYLDISRGAPSYNSGTLFGQIIIKDNIGIYNGSIYDETSECHLSFEFKDNSLIIKTKDGADCYFGYGVFADKTYYIKDKSMPEYFMENDEDTIHFKGLTVEKYNKRYQ